MDSGLQDELDLNGALLLVTKQAADISTIHIYVTLQTMLTIYFKRHERQRHKLITSSSPLLSRSPRTACTTCRSSTVPKSPIKDLQYKRDSQ